MRLDPILMQAHGDALALLERPASPLAAPREVTLGTGLVTGGPALRLRPDGAIAGVADAAFEIAASCLLQPSAGDRVAWLRDGAGTWYVTAVLTRGTAAAPDVCLPAGSVLRSASGDLSLRAAQRLGLSGESVSVAAGRLNVTARASELAIGTLRAVGQSVSAVFDRLFSASRQHQRVVEGIDQVQAQVIEYRAATVASIDADHVSVSGQKLAKLRAAQIHMG